MDFNPRFASFKSYGISKIIFILFYEINIRTILAKVLKISKKNEQIDTYKDLAKFF